MGQFCLGESQSRIYPNMCVCQILLRSDGRVEKGGVQTDKGTLQVYIVENTDDNGTYFLFDWI